MRKKILLTLSIFLLLFENIFAGAWTQKKGHGFYKFTFGFVSADKVHGPDGSNFDIPQLNDFSFSLFGEYGITDRFTFFGTFPFLKLTTVDSTQFNPNTLAENNVSGIGDISFGIKYLISRFGSSVLSVSINFGIPTGKSDPIGGLILGDGEFNQAVNLQLGHSFYPVPLYFNISTLYNNRTEGYSDEFYYLLESGYTFNPKFTFIFRFTGKNSLKNGNEKSKGGFGGLFWDEQQYISLSGQLVYNFNKSIGISGSYEFGVSAKNIFSAPVLAVGIFFKN